jgi:alkanesulfonate monooxygenase SsuD/methylene tetrahydromethanopterin reductase-like flavin-dependent oxidoreductase (luciferase family)
MSRRSRGFHKVNGVALNVRPRQPPPIHVAILRREAAYHVGRKGQRIMSIPYATLDRLDEVEGIVQEFRRGRAEAGLEPDEDHAIFAFHAHVARTDAEARAEAAEAFDLYVATRLYAKHQTYDDIIASGLALFGSVETVTDKLLSCTPSASATSRCCPTSA